MWDNVWQYQVLGPEAAGPWVKGRSECFGTFMVSHGLVEGVQANLAARLVGGGEAGICNCSAPG